MTTMSSPWLRAARHTPALLAAAGSCVLATGCVLVMDLDFDRYHANESGADASAGMGGAGGEGGTAGTGTGGAGAEGGMAGSGGMPLQDAPADEPARPSCDDGIQNQGEQKVDCGGPCPPCPGFAHHETFDTFPTPGPDGPYAIYGACFDDSLVDGWVLSNVPDAAFPLGTGYYALIDTTKLLYSGLECNDKLATPTLAANGATKATISFDTTFAMLTASHAEVIFVRNSTPEVVWSAYQDVSPQRVTIPNLPVQGASTVRVLFRYVGEFDGYWMVDDIEVIGE